MYRSFLAGKTNMNQIAETETTKLPSLSFKIVGEVKKSNLTEYKKTALAFIEEINVELETDEDFIEASKNVKACRDAEKELEAIKTRALNETEDIKILFDAIVEMETAFSAKRLTLTKLARTRKDGIKAEAIYHASKELIAHTNSLNAEIKPLVLPFVESGFEGATKGLKTVKSLKDAINKKLDEAKAKTDEHKKHIDFNLETLRQLADDHRFLFNDLQSIIMRDHDYFELIVKTRIKDYKAAEQIKADAVIEAERIAIAEQEAADLAGSEQEVATPSTIEPAIPVKEAMASFAMPSGCTSPPKIKVNGEDHKAAIEKAAIAGFVKWGVKPSVAAMVVSIIAKGAIPEIAISYKNL